MRKNYFLIRNVLLPHIRYRINDNKANKIKTKFTTKKTNNLNCILNRILIRV